jgi:hypothetical protein
VERAHGTHQDRLVKKLRLAGISSYAEANRYLDGQYLADHNRRYGRAAASAVDYHRRRPTARQLDAVFWLEEERVVSCDWVVSFKTRLLQLGRQSRHYAPTRSRVTVRENEQGELAILYRGRPLGFKEIFVRPQPAAAPPRPSMSPASRGHARPSPKHPWKQPFKPQTATPLLATA